MKLTFPINIKSGIVQNNFELENFIFFKNKILFKFCINKQTETYLPQMASDFNRYLLILFAG